ncbi:MULTISPECIES: YihY/virulence factor BrkB family protein [unclassified Gordonia (in: high G+C Gram-positive bacteria)]|uniref:YihY/virulence factor BrkB family protein n=1 Tax=unclassified Gordonia (in: high G+C Gram-positive bacteria) TaxID=2657482 RepID=UPI00071D48EE|nr:MULTISPECIES: YihY/virulence factor BrkB family protein [unclassified Gordonia (in: high G+C Gram-positive bacteria)]SCB96552.1 inner membrane protein YhjD [Gordonia sp. v-85]
MSLTERVDRFQRRHPATGFPLAVIYKFVDDQGAYLAALCAYYAFISLFPLLLLFATVLGIVLADNPDLQDRILDSAMSQIPVIGGQLGEPEKLSGGATAIIIGVVVSLYGGLGVAVAAQNAMNTIWAVPRNERPDPIFARLRGLLLLSTIGVAVIGLTVVNGVSAAFELGIVGRWLAILGSVALSTLVFTVAFRIGTARDVSIRDVLPGAFGAAVCWQIIQTFGAVYVQHVIGNASSTNGVFAIVLGLLAFLYVSSIVIVICLETNAVRVDRLYPRSLLTPFTDNVSLTKGDEAAYSAQVLAQRNKGFQEIDVSFDNPRDVESGAEVDQRSPGPERG